MLDIREKEELTPEQFILICSKIWANWGMPVTAGRVLAFLHLQSEAVTLEQIAEALEISKAGAWAATRHLETVRQIDRLGAPGSKRALFVIKSDLARSMFNYNKLMHRMGVIMLQGVDAASGSAAKQQLRERAELYVAVHEAIETTVADTLQVMKWRKGK